MQTRALLSLVTIAQVRSFSATADQLGMTLSTLSMQMKTLEEQLGTALFDRSVRPPQLTPVGRAVAEEARALLSHEDRLRALCRPSDALTGHIRIGFVTTAAVRLLPGFLLAAQSRAPLATFDFETGLSAALQERVLAGQLDAAIVTDATGLPEQLSARLLREEPFAYAAHRDLMANGLDGLLKTSSFFHFMPDTGIGKLIAGAMRHQARTEGARTVVLDNLEAIMGCVAAGMGFTLLPVPDVARYRTPEVTTLAGPAGLRRKLVLVTLRDGPLSRHAASLARLLADGMQPGGVGARPHKSPSGEDRRASGGSMPPEPAPPR